MRKTKKQTPSIHPFYDAVIAPRPKLDEKPSIVLSTRIPESISASLASISAYTGVSKNQILIRLLDFGLEALGTELFEHFPQLLEPAEEDGEVGFTAPTPSLFRAIINQNLPQNAESIKGIRKALGHEKEGK